MLLHVYMFGVSQDKILIILWQYPVLSPEEWNNKLFFHSCGWRLECTSKIRGMGEKWETITDDCWNQGESTVSFYKRYLLLTFRDWKQSAKALQCRSLGMKLPNNNQNKCKLWLDSVSHTHAQNNYPHSNQKNPNSYLKAFWGIFWKMWLRTRD